MLAPLLKLIPLLLDVLKMLVNNFSNLSIIPRRHIIEPAHKLKIDQNKLQNCRSNILNLVNVL
ncbi:hypothetical protein D1AOALGA4SA_8026 [Olavius algarvensis Delta 1 endosymbiont]|nr:hypothetical protein D1AOALGA4SA_8026 [Olavius algarvensis Delta 1 endosymbiont]